MTLGWRLVRWPVWALIYLLAWAEMAYDGLRLWWLARARKRRRARASRVLSRSTR